MVRGCLVVVIVVVVVVEEVDVISAGLGVWGFDGCGCRCASFPFPSSHAVSSPVSNPQQYRLFFSFPRRYPAQTRVELIYLPSRVRRRYLR